jgi:hypothetical protein
VASVCLSVCLSVCALVHTFVHPLIRPSVGHVLVCLSQPLVCPQDVEYDDRYYEQDDRKGFGQMGDRRTYDGRGYPSTYRNETSPRDPGAYGNGDRSDAYGDDYSRGGSDEPARGGRVSWGRLQQPEYDVVDDWEV